ncbi:MAG: electron transfer flavoprotein subunit alpha [Acidobacteriota bacterium]|nr:MAG: electron transfer flavoprotein subunit alpha [Acidobacteriota bacterium]
MEKILLLAFTETDGTLGKPGLEVLSAALKIREGLAGAELVVGLVGAKVGPAAGQIVGCSPSRILGVEGEHFSQSRYGTDAAAAEAICKAAEATIILAAGTARANRVLSGVAHRLQGNADTHVCGVDVADGALKVTRWYYRQRMQAVLQRSSRPWVIICDPSSFAPWTGSSRDDAFEAVAVPVPDSMRTTVTGTQAPASGAQTIRPDTEVLFVAGAGWTKSQADGKVKVNEAEPLILGFLDLTKASLGGSKSMVDLAGEGQQVLSFMTHLNQIGQTGATPRHPKGLATCCHGEEPHAVGWRFINERRAINKDPNCGWAQGKADVLYVEDAFAVMARVNELLKESK